ncbi:Imm15 family immunity protein [[Mycoplasma] gypis]|uniref:Imm15 family immunity protein n=1 Tax=[Mycoplasma] gypis TaxID=92404 RepID=A0ABZ2RN14_9BACT|nr:Imm15 family immunity protein [[Mycoplasma] gypis]MBN0919569.1 hypothetical protein [[Mycoplasma] gypis]
MSKQHSNLKTFKLISTIIFIILLIIGIVLMVLGTEIRDANQVETKQYLIWVGLAFILGAILYGVISIAILFKKSYKEVLVETLNNEHVFIQKTKK